MPEQKIPCQYQGPGKQNPVSVGDYDMIRLTDDPSDPDYWVTSGVTSVYDAGHDNGSGGILNFHDRLRISKGAAGDCSPTVTLDLEANPLVYSYYPPHSLDVIFVLDVTASSIDRPGNAFLISCLRGFLLVIPIAFLFSALLGLTGIWLTVPAAEAIVTLVVLFLLYRSGKNI